MVAGKRVNPRVRALVVPGSAGVSGKRRGRGLDRVFEAAGLSGGAPGLLDVPWDEPRHPPAGRAMRFDLEPELRGSAGTRRAHAPRQPGNGRGDSARGHFVDVRELSLEPVA